MREQKGITLIALVITIIVLLILAGVTIAMLTGQNGILTNGNKSNCENSYRGADEQMRLAYMSVRTQIMANAVNTSTYSPSKTDTAANELRDIVRKDLGWTKSGDDWSTNNSKFIGVYVADDDKKTEKTASDTETTTKKIVIVYKDNAIDQGLIDSTKALTLNSGQTPLNDTYVYGEIYLGTQANQSASYKYDTTTVTSGTTPTIPSDS